MPNALLMTVKIPPFGQTAICLYKQTYYCNYRTRVSTEVELLLLIISGIQVISTKLY